MGVACLVVVLLLVALSDLEWGWPVVLVAAIVAVMPVARATGSDAARRAGVDARRRRSHR